jgi:hypothetical protein
LPNSKGDAIDHSWPTRKGNEQEARKSRPTHPLSVGIMTSIYGFEHQR